MNHKPTARALALGQGVHDAMVRKGMQNNDLGSALGWRPCKMSRLKVGTRYLSLTDISAALGRLEVIGPDRDELLALAEGLRETTWLLPRPTRPLTRLRILHWITMAAATITSYSPGAVPTHLQSKEYIRSLAAGPHGHKTSDQASWVGYRVTSQAELISKPPRMQFFVDETALVGGASEVVLSDQVQHMVKLGFWPEVSNRLLSEGASNCRYPPFTLLTFTNHRPLVYLEVLDNVLFLEDEHDLAAYHEVVDTLTERALSPGETQQWLLDRTGTPDNAP
jgi:hypothetical protein